MPKNLAALLLAAIAVTGSSFAGSSAQAQMPEAATITVQGSGSVDVEPDMAEITIGVEARGASPAEAIDGVSTAMARVIADAEKAGVPKRDIRTAVLYLSPNQDKSLGKGFVAANAVQIRLREVKRLGAVTRDLVASGANVIRGIAFSVAEPKPHLEEARRLAVRDARRKAEVLSEAAGRRLGALVEIIDNGGDAVPMMHAGAMQKMRADVPSEPGQISLGANVQIKWRLDP